MSDSRDADRISVDRVANTADRRAFVDFPRRLYRDSRCWVPFFNAEYRDFFARRHPFFAHTHTEFLTVRRGGQVLARTMMIDNARYNEEHGTRCANFYFTDFVDDDEVTDELFDAMARWAHARGLGELRGPLFSGATYGGGVLIEGFELPAAMTMMPYNAPYYARHYERAGFTKRFDLNSLGARSDRFVLPEKVERLAEQVRRRGRFQVLRFRTKRDLRQVAHRVAGMYNTTLADHGENYPLTDAELERLIKDLLVIARPDLEKVITYDEDVVGFVLTFPDATRAIQRSRGRLGPAQFIALLREIRTTDRLILNGMGILPQYQRLGGNALVYSELARTVRSPRYRFSSVELVQINEETDLMLSDMYRLGAQRIKLHRVFERSV
ncbi:MAG: hypothetical protein EA382_14095 [Spirochaetaceae bacterium]|nr:MAG: hypothetical protein EA382_14095 [Spirochaetaceae bacterium]